jgi:CDP-4-dehydro-6-deoxyglucose reductase
LSAQIKFASGYFDVQDGETLLDCLTRNGVPVPHSCRAGVCQACLLQATEGEIPHAAQAGLKPSYLKQSLLLACRCKPTGHMTVRLPQDAGVDFAVYIAAYDMLNHNVLRLSLAPDQPFACEPGQYITLVNPDGVARSYSVANHPEADGYIELHIRLLAGGRMSDFLKNHGAIKTPLTLRGPAGTCFYVPDADIAYPIILAGTGTGLAPLYGILREALSQGHAGPIQLFHGALHERDLYLTDALRQLVRTHTNVDYTPCVMNGAPGRFYRSGNIQDIVLAALPPSKAGLRLYLCGAPEFVTSLRRKAFLAGIGSSFIFADAFLPSAPPSVELATT